MKKSFFLFLYVCGFISSVEGIPLHNLPERFMKAVGSIEYDSLGGKEAVCEVQRLDAHTLHMGQPSDTRRGECDRSALLPDSGHHLAG